MRREKNGGGPASAGRMADCRPYLFRGCPRPRRTGGYSGGLNSPGESERWGGGRSLPPEIGGHWAAGGDSEPHSLWGGGAKTVPGRRCPQERPPVCVVDLAIAVLVAAGWGPGAEYVSRLL